jgi:ubiquinone/menaquinone biosynthesis C-methylase UbiE
MSVRPEWPITFFDEDYLKIYRPQLTEERNRLETEFIAGALDLPHGATVLDLACGLGRHAIGMAKLGYPVTGVDFNPRYLEIGAEDAEKAGVTVRWMVGDMRALQFEEAFDGAYSFFTSFGYFAEGENEQVIANLSRALRRSGRFLIDMANRDWILTHPQQRTWTQQQDGGLLMEEATLDPASSRVVSRLTLISPQGGAQVTKEFNLRLYTCAELTAMFARHGLSVKQVWGGADRSDYSADSRRLILLAEREAGGTGDAG